MARGYESAGISYNEIEILPTTVGEQTAPIAVVGGATKGTTDITLCTSPNNLKNLFGDVVQNDYGVRSVKRVLKNSTQVFFKRVIGKDAARGSAKISGCPFSFTTREFDSTLENATIKLVFDTTAKTVEYFLFNVAGEELEHIVGFSCVKGDKFYIGDLFDKKTDFLNLVIDDDFEDDPSTFLKTSVPVTAIIATPADVSAPTAVYEGSNDFDDISNIELLISDADGNSRTQVLSTSEVVDGFIIEENNDDDTFKVNWDGTGVWNYTEVKLSYVLKTDAMTQVLTITGCNDGIDSLTADDIIAGMNEFSNSEAIDISTLIAPGWADPKVHEAGLQIAQTRGDILFIPELPNGITPKGARAFVDATGVYKLTNKQMKSGFTAVFYPWVKEWDNTLGREIETPTSAWVASQLAYNDAVGKQWFAAAGLQAGQNRGLMTDATGTAYELTKDDRDFLYGTEGVINPIANFQGKGVVLWGNKTTKRTPLNEVEAPTCALNVRRLCNYIRKQIISISMSNLFDPNDSYNWNSWVLALEPKLRAVKEARGIEKYKIVMDASTVSDEDKYYGRMPGQVYILPIKAAEFIPINFVVTQDGIYFDD